MSGPWIQLPQRVALTGAAGSLASDIIPALQEAGIELRCIDRVRPLQDFGADWAICDVNDRAALSTALSGCDALIHLAGIPLEDDWDRILRANIDGTQAVLESARLQGITKAVLASSIHAVGFTPVPADGTTVPDETPVRPNTFYGVSKAALEALGSYYHDRHGMDVTCLRIASRFEQPRDARMLSTWLSPADAGSLFLHALDKPSSGYRIIWGVSANTRGYLSAAGGSAIGYEPVDDAELWAPGLIGPAAQENLQPSEWDQRFIGGIFCSPLPPRQPSQSTDTQETR
ncbi:NAD(P)-dependent oxidoreductase [Arthrobacter sp. Sa2BUA2]|uniref:NAD(P)-dependent oxidoreductase n=1 Tax=Arthrobacter pullicola TaxID=2762224 RepID=A0ABR8YDY0_9MICC|nr:NAD(P)-dependent oxidoreductase [Arthrobacter pullicola]MBD8042424.1 NAD(P)-dependent oxidoreductase [Arthrobacter pullicola]